jgi:hypothetical protein
MKNFETAKIAAAAMIVIMASPVSAAASGPVRPFAEYSQPAPRRGLTPKILYYKNEDVLKTTSVTTRTPIYTTVQVPVYRTVTVPVYDRRGNVIGSRTTQVQDGTQSVQKITGYNTVVTKSTHVTPKAELYTTNGSTATPAAVPVAFTYLTTPGRWPALAGTQNALFSLSAVSTMAAQQVGSTYGQLFDSGIIAFRRVVPLYRVNSHGVRVSGPLDNLLTVTFTNAILMTARGGSTMSFTTSSSGTSTINFTSDFVSFTQPGFTPNFDFSLAGTASNVGMSLAAIDPALTNVTGARSLNTFRTSTVGSFSASSPAPEPATWGMMVAGFGLAGAAIRSAKARRRTAAI